MLCYIIMLLISIFLEGLFSNVFSNLHILFLIANILIGLLFIKDDKVYYIITIPLLIIYDIIYTSSFLYNTSVIIFMTIIIKKFKIKNIFNLLVSYILFLILYVFIISSTIYIDFITLFKSIIINSIFFIISYLIYLLYNKIINKNYNS